MPDYVLRFASVVFTALVLAGCGEKQPENAQQPTAAGSYGQNDAECFAGIVRVTDEKQMSLADFNKWKEKLGDKDKIWMGNFSGYYMNVTRIVTSHMGKTNQELADAKLITDQQRAVIEGYLKVAQENDADKAKTLAASACASVGFKKGLDLN